MASTSSVEATIAELRAELEGLSGGGDAENLIMQILQESLDKKENKLEDYKTKAEGQMLVVKNYCPLGMKGVDKTSLADMMSKGQLQAPPFAQIFVSENESSEPKQCVPVYVDVRKGAQPSTATAAAIGRMIVEKLAKNPNATFTVQCDAFSESKTRCDHEAPTSCGWYRNGCFDKAFIVQQKEINLENVKKALKRKGKTDAEIAENQTVKNLEKDLEEAKTEAAKAEAQKKKAQAEGTAAASAAASAAAPAASS